jgi:ABC-type nitrate/sulfonate/bicarbonate transport system substrate-binding protein
MKKTVIVIIVILILFTLVFAWKKFAPVSHVTANSTFTVALDWTPNTNHTGIYVALEKGWYKKQGLNVKILPYGSTSPDLLVETGKADVGISATEGVLEDAATGNPVVSIAAIVQHDIYGLVANADEGIKTPKDLDSKVYGGWGSSYEQPVISKVIRDAGGNGSFKNVTLTVDAMQALETKKIDFVWVSQGWEVIAAKREGMHVVFFPMSSYGIPDYYTPVIITSPKEIQQKKALLKKFMIATSEGYDYAIQHPKEAAAILITGAPKGTFPDTGLVYQSQEFLSKHYVDPGRKWGLQDSTAWHNYPEFLLHAGAVVDANGKPVKKLHLDSLYTNEFLQ